MSTGTLGDPAAARPVAGLAGDRQEAPKPPVVDLAARLGPDLAALVATLAVPVVDALPITGLRARELSRATYRLTLADGRVMKGRHLDAVADAERIRTTVAKLGRPELPRILAHGGKALLEEWIVGEPLGRVVPDMAVVEQAGHILGAIHATPVDPDPVGVHHSATPVPTRDSGGRSRPEIHQARVEWTIGELLSDGVVSATVAANLRGVVHAHLPTEIATGFVHRDFCGENMVLGPGGDLFVVDSGNVGIDAYDLDLARTWYRWPLPEAARRAFEAGYRVHRNPDAYFAHFPFWAVAALTSATLFRTRARTTGWRVPLRRLERLLKDLGRGHVPAR